MPVLDKEYLNQISRSYRSRLSAVDEVVYGVMLEAYEAVTGKTPSDRFREKIEDAVVYDQ